MMSEESKNQVGEEQTPAKQKLTVAEFKEWQAQQAAAKESASVDAPAEATVAGAPKTRRSVADLLASKEAAAADAAPAGASKTRRSVADLLASVGAAASPAADTAPAEPKTNVQIAQGKLESKFRKELDILKSFADHFALPDTAVLADGTTNVGQTAVGFTSQDAVIHFVPIQARFKPEEMRNIQQAAANLTSKGEVTLESLAEYRATAFPDRPRMDEIISSAKQIRENFWQDPEAREFPPEKHAEAVAMFLNSLQAQYNGAAVQSPLHKPIEGKLAQADNGTLHVNLEKFRVITDVFENIDEVLGKQAVAHSTQALQRHSQAMVYNQIAVTARLKEMAQRPDVIAQGQVNVGGSQSSFTRRVENDRAAGLDIGSGRSI